MLNLSQKDNIVFSSQQNKTSECVICGSKDFIFLFEAYDYLYFSTAPFNFMKCFQCGQISVIPRPNGKYSYAPVSYKKLDKTDVWHFLNPNRANLVVRFKKRGRILDIGCGLGEFLFDMKNHGWEIFGNDISSAACDYAKTQFGLENIYDKDLLLIDLPAKFFDAVTIWHALGYLTSPLETLKKINNILKDDGIVIIESPNFESPQRHFFRKKWFGLVLPDIFYHFSVENLEKVLRLAGLRIIKKDYFVNLRINFVSFKKSLSRVLHLERIPDEKGNNETTFLIWMKKYKLIVIFEVICFLASFSLALINCGTCFRIYCMKIKAK